MRQHIPLAKQEKLLESSEPVLTFDARDEDRLQHQLDVATLQTLQLIKKQQTKLQRELHTVSNHVDIRLKKIFRGGHLDLLDEADSPRLSTFASGARPEAAAAPPSSRRLRTRSSPPPRWEGGTSFAGKTISSLLRHSLFPVAFEASEFSSSIHWGEVAFTEASVAALGPRAKVEGPSRGALPNPLLVNVACYILNEVLRRDSNMCGLWDLLRDTILDSIYTPLRIDDGVQGVDSQTGEEGGGAFVPAASDSDSRAKALAYPLRNTTYKTFDFSNYRLWIQEIVALQHRNDIPWQRIQVLKSLLGKAIHVLELGQRRVNNSRLRKVLVAWHRYTKGVHAFRQAAYISISNSIRRRLEGQCFLRWRRSTLQGILEKLYRSLSDHRRESRLNEQAHLNTIYQLRSQLSAATESKQLVQAEMGDQLLGAKESHKLAEKVLREAYKRSVKYAKRYKAHASRWERLAKTFRPAELCPSIPKPLSTLSISLTQYEDDLSKSHRVSAFRIERARRELSNFLLCWVNTVMRASPQGKMWVPRVNLACSSNQAQSDGAVWGDATIKPKLLDETALLCLVRELRRLQDLNDPNKQEGSDCDDPFRGPNLLDTGDIADSLQTVLEEAYQVLYVYTSEGLYPCLLMHSPSYFFQHRAKETGVQSFSKHRQNAELVYMLSMLWLLAALFTGYVRYHHGVEAFLASKWPHYLRCPNEKKLRHSSRQSLGVASVSSLTEFPNGSISGSSRAPARDDDGDGQGGTPDCEAGGLLKRAPEPALGLGVSNAIDPLIAGVKALKRTYSSPRRDHTGAYTYGGDEVVDTNSDIDVYTGRQDADLPPSDWEKDIDGLFNNVVRNEEREMRKQRRLRRKGEKCEELIRASGNSTLPYVKLEGLDGSEGSNTKPLPSQGRLTHREQGITIPDRSSIEKFSSRGVSSEGVSMDPIDSTPRVENDSEICSISSSESEVRSASGESSINTNSEEENEAMSLEDNKHRSKSLFGEPHDSFNVVRQRFLSKVPPPSSVFSVRIGKKTKKKDPNNSVRLMEFMGERTEARRQERARKGGLHAFVERTLMDQERRQQWLGMSRVVVSLITRLDLLNLNIKTKTGKVHSTERSNAFHDRPENSLKSQSKGDSDSRVSLSHRTKTSSISRNTVSSRSILMIPHDGLVDTVDKSSYSNSKDPETHDPPTLGKSSPTQQGAEKKTPPNASRRGFHRANEPIPKIHPQTRRPCEVFPSTTPLAVEGSAFAMR
ncbi:unnamed protein product [Phytomonas sp. Hart1]|nr:unnamed protein product [Phytomonas sp. Hart1]|eukprot:CCW69235.1 unnamed protein product [Phytomonas sp. isolate Hart1]